MSKTGRCCCSDGSLKLQHQSEVVEGIPSIERALAAFHFTVARAYGGEEADKAAEDWIEEFQNSEADVNTDWRSVTATAAQRLAYRVAASVQL